MTRNDNAGVSKKIDIYRAIGTTIIILAAGLVLHEFVLSPLIGADRAGNISGGMDNKECGNDINGNDTLDGFGIKGIDTTKPQAADTTKPRAADTLSQQKKRKCC